MAHSRRLSRREARPRRLAAAVQRAYGVRPIGCSMLLVLAASTWAAPQGGQVVAGQAQVGRVGNLTNITQQSQRAVIDWRSFDVAATEAVEFRQPGATAVTLNRVLGSDPSAIFGRITANGSVFLVNQNGILFGESAQVNVGGLVATTANIANADFMAGNYRFTEKGRAEAKVENRGTIRIADNGIAALVGRQVSNSGFIVARLGKVTLAAGDAFVLDITGDRLVNLVLDPAALETTTDAQGLPLVARVDNTGNIQAAGGVVQLSADTVSRLLDNVVNVQGDIRATSAEARNGVISLGGGASTDVMTGGVLQASGRIDIAGRDVAIGAASQIDLRTGAPLGIAAGRDVRIAAELNALGEGGVAGAALGIEAGRNVAIERNVVLNAAAMTIAAGGTVNAAEGVVLQAGSGAITIGGGTGVSLGQVLTRGAVDLSSSGGDVIVTSAIVGAGTGDPVAAESLRMSAGGNADLAGALVAQTIDVTAGGNVQLRGASLVSQLGDIAVDANGSLQSTGSSVGLASLAGGLQAHSGSNMTIDTALASGTLALRADGALTVGRTLGANGGAANRIEASAGTQLVLAGAQAGAGGLVLASDSGDITSIGANAGLLSASGISITASHGSAGTLAAPLALSAAGTANVAGSSGGVSVEGQAGVQVAGLLTPGPVLLRSEGNVTLATAMAASPGDLGGAAATRGLRIEANGAVSLAGARLGADGLVVAGNGQTGAGAFDATGSVVSDGAVDIRTQGAIQTSALLQSGAGITLASSAAGIRIGDGGVRTTAAGTGLSFIAQGNVTLDGDLHAQAGTIAITSGGQVVAKVGTPGANPVVGDATIDAGADTAQSSIVVDGTGGVTLGGLRAAHAITIGSTQGNVVLLSPLGGASTGYDNFAAGYQAALRPDVGALTINAPAGSVELNGLNLDGLADPHASGEGLRVAVGQIVLSNATIAVNKGAILLQAGATGATDGVYLGASVFSRGWDSVGSDGARGGTGSAADEKVGYGIRIAGRNLALFDNTSEMAELPGLFRTTLSNGTTVLTDMEARVVNNDGVATTTQRVVKDSDTISDLTDIHLANVVDPVNEGALLVLGRPITRTVAKVEIANNAANYRDADAALRDRLVPTSDGSVPAIQLDVTSIGGLTSAAPAAGEEGVRLSLSTLNPVVGVPSAVPIGVTVADPNTSIAGAHGVALKMLGFASGQDATTETWNTNVGFTAAPSNPSPFSFYGVTSVFDLNFDGDLSFPNPVLGSVTNPVRGVFQMQVINDFVGASCSPCTATYTLERLPGNLSGFARITDIRLPGQNPTSTIAWVPVNAATEMGVGSVLQMRFNGTALISTSGIASFAQLGTAQLAGAAGYGGALLGGGQVSPSPLTTITMPIYSQTANGGLQLNSLNHGTDSIANGYSMGRIVVDADRASTTQNGTRLLIFDGVIDNQIARSVSDLVGGNYVPGFGGIGGRNNSTTGFASVGANVGGVTGSTGQVSTSPSNALQPGVAGGVGGSGVVGAAPVPPADTGFQFQASVTDRSGVDALSALTGERPEDGTMPVLQFGRSPGSQADFGRGGGVPSVAPNVFRRGYRLATSPDGAACLPGTIEQERGAQATPNARECR